MFKQTPQSVLQQRQRPRLAPHVGQDQRHQARLVPHPRQPGGAFDRRPQAGVVHGPHPDLVAGDQVAQVWVGRALGDEIGAQGQEHRRMPVRLSHRVEQGVNESLPLLEGAQREQLLELVYHHHHAAVVGIWARTSSGLLSRHKLGHQFVQCVFPVEQAFLDLPSCLLQACEIYRASTSGHAHCGHQGPG